jgi:hypothetical protein
VYAEAVRDGSGDAGIDPATIKGNNFANFFDQHRSIQYVFFNGENPMNHFRDYVLWDKPTPRLWVPYLKSTSPRSPLYPRDVKAELWRAEFLAAVPTLFGKGNIQP